MYTHHAAGEHLLSAAQMYFSVSAWGLALMYLYWSLFRPKIPFGIILLPIILLFLAGSVLFPYNNSAVSNSADIPLWVMLHTIVIFLVTASVIIGGVAGILYLLQDYRLHRKEQPQEKIPLPSLEWSLAVCKKAVKAAAVFLAATVLTGSHLYQHCPASSRIRITVSDPLIIGTLLMFIFFVYAAGSVSFKTDKTGGRKLAVISVIAMLLLVLMILFGWFGSAHWR
ncbi:MAG: hypothetical protein LBT46_12200 [Planctomycetaceae bacterium]|nr:hypothetical protein [Planctomycetaceae bacterium]